MKEKSRLTYRFLKFTMGDYARVEEKLTACLADIGTAGVRRLVLLGARAAERKSVTGRPPMHPGSTPALWQRTSTPLH